MKYLLFSFFAFSALYLSSCTCKCTYVCNEGGLYINTIGFDTTDIDSAFFVSYKANNAFDSVVDTISFRNIQLMLEFVRFSNDTEYLGGFFGAGAGNDYRLIFPTLNNRTFSITNIKSGGDATEELPYKCEAGCYGGNYCQRTLASCTIDGQNMSFNSKYPTYYFVK